MPSKEKNISSSLSAGIFGIVLIIIGLLLLFGNITSILSIKKLWPLFMMIPVLIFISLLVQDFKAHYGVLMPAALLTFLTIYFLWLNYTAWENVKYTWPNFLLAPASGLFALYIANREKGLLIPVCVLAALAVIFYGIIFQSGTIVGIAFLIFGIILIISPFFRKR